MGIKLGLIYKATSKTTNKSYIGLTTNNLQERIKQHFYKANGTSKNNPFQDAILKYGIDDFVFEILEDNIPDPELDYKEAYYISTHNTKTPDGYNVLVGGRVEGTEIMGRSNAKGVYKIDPNTFKVLSYQPSLSEMAKEVGTTPIRISDVCHRKAYTSKGYAFRFIFDFNAEEVKEHLAQKQAKKPIPIISYNIETNEVLNYYPSIYQASIELNLSSGSISDYLKGNRDRAGTKDNIILGFKYYESNSAATQRNKKAELNRLFRKEARTTTYKNLKV